MWATQEDGHEARAVQQMLWGSTGNAELEMYSFAVAGVLSADERLRALRCRDTHTRLSRAALVMGEYKKRLLAELSLQEWACAQD